MPEEGSLAYGVKDFDEIFEEKTKGIKSEKSQHPNSDKKNS